MSMVVSLRAEAVRIGQIRACANTAQAMRGLFPADFSLHSPLDRGRLFVAPIPQATPGLSATAGGTGVATNSNADTLLAATCLRKSGYHAGRARKASRRGRSPARCARPGASSA